MDTDTTDLPTYVRPSPVPSEPKPALPWGPAHEREALIRLCELALDAARRGDRESAMWFAGCAGDILESAVATEDAFRRVFWSEPDWSPVQIDANVALVRLRADGPSVFECVEHVCPSIIDHVDHGCAVCAGDPCICAWA